MVCTIIMILAAMAAPIARFSIRRQKEIELRYALRQLRSAIDDYKQKSDSGLIPVELGSEGYPKKLEILVEGVDLVGQVKKKHRWLRKIPMDPMTRDSDWGKRSYQDEPNSHSWGGQNVYDVFSTSDGTGLDGTKYRDW